MMKFYEVREPRQSRYTGDISARHKWSLPGLRCPECRITASGGFTAYPSVDLSSFPQPILDAASLPAHADLFRLSDFETIFIATEAEACGHLWQPSCLSARWAVPRERRPIDSCPPEGG